MAWCDNCSNMFHEAEAMYKVKVSVNGPADEERNLCESCYQAYIWGRQHGRIVTEAGLKTYDFDDEPIDEYGEDDGDEVVYQPEHDDKVWEDAGFYSFEVYHSKDKAQQDFPTLKILEFHLSDIEEPTFVDDGD